jgi:hypothetical protein
MTTRYIVCRHACPRPCPNIIRYLPQRSGGRSVLRGRGHPRNADVKPPCATWTTDAAPGAERRRRAGDPPHSRRGPPSPAHRPHRAVATGSRRGRPPTAPGRRASGWALPGPTNPGRAGPRRRNDPVRTAAAGPGVPGTSKAGRTNGWRLFLCVVGNPLVLHRGSHISRMCRVQARHASLFRADPLFASCMRNYERRRAGDHTSCAISTRECGHTADRHKQCSPAGVAG